MAFALLTADDLLCEVDHRLVHPPVNGRVLLWPVRLPVQFYFFTVQTGAGMVLSGPFYPRAVNGFRFRGLGHEQQAKQAGCVLVPLAGIQGGVRLEHEIFSEITGPEGLPPEPIGDRLGIPLPLPAARRLWQILRKASVGGGRTYGLDCTGSVLRFSTGTQMPYARIEQKSEKPGYLTGWADALRSLERAEQMGVLVSEEIGYQMSFLGDRWFETASEIRRRLSDLAELGAEQAPVILYGSERSDDFPFELFPLEGDEFPFFKSAESGAAAEGFISRFSSNRRPANEPLRPPVYLSQSVRRRIAAQPAGDGAHLFRGP